MTKQWNRYRPEEVATLRRMHAAGASREAMALALRRGTQSVAHKCNELGLLPHVAPTPWTEERIAELRRLWDAGWSGTEIGREIGLTKNQCIGKAHRLGLKPRPSPIVKRARALPPTLADERAMGKRMPDERPREHESLRMDCPAEDGPCEPEQDAERPCQWPLWDKGPPTGEFCGRHQRRLGDGWSPYCPEHHVRAYAGRPAPYKAA